MKSVLFLFFISFAAYGQEINFGQLEVVQTTGGQIIATLQNPVMEDSTGTTPVDSFKVDYVLRHNRHAIQAIDPQMFEWIPSNEDTVVFQMKYGYLEIHAEIHVWHEGQYYFQYSNKIEYQDPSHQVTIFEPQIGLNGFGINANGKRGTVHIITNGTTDAEVRLSQNGNKAYLFSTPNPFNVDTFRQFNTTGNYHKYITIRTHFSDGSYLTRRIGWYN